MTESQNISRQASGKTLPVIALAISGLMLAAVYWRTTHTQASEPMSSNTSSGYIATVMTPDTSAADGLVLPGEIHPFTEAAIHARIDGYLKTRKAELGEQVKQGDILAEIDSPETDQQLEQAEADLATAEANDAVAQTTAERWTKLLATHAVSREDVDLKTAEAHAKKAQVASARANVERLAKLKGFEKVIAPFDGVITARNVDIGTLVTSGNTASSTPELFHLADISKLRIFVQVPQQQALLIKTDTDATITVPEQPGQKIPARLVRTAQAIDPATHTLLAELEVDNSKRTLLSGGYCEVHLPLATPGSFRVPASALIFGSDGLKVATVDANARVALKPVSVGQDFGKQIEITNGLSAEDRVITNPWDSIATGQAVTANAAPPADTATKK